MTHERLWRRKALLEQRERSMYGHKPLTHFKSRAALRVNQATSQSVNFFLVHFLWGRKKKGRGGGYYLKFDACHFFSNATVVMFFFQNKFINAERDKNEWLNLGKQLSTLLRIILVAMLSKEKRQYVCKTH